MFLLENMKVFVRFSQIFSFLPYYIDRHSHSNRFKQITFSQNHPATWWFFIISLFQIAFLVWRCLKAWFSSRNDGVLVFYTSSIFSFVLPMDVLFTVTMTAIFRYTIFRNPHLCQAQICLKKAHQLLNRLDHFPSQDVETASRAIRKRSVIGVILVVFIVSIINLYNN